MGNMVGSISLYFMNYFKAQQVSIIRGDFISYFNEYG